VHEVGVKQIDALERAEDYDQPNHQQRDCDALVVKDNIKEGHGAIDTNKAYMHCRSDLFKGVQPLQMNTIKVSHYLSWR
jgi:hypothetical protein